MKDISVREFFEGLVLGVGVAFGLVVGAYLSSLALPWVKAFSDHNEQKAEAWGSRP